MFIDLNGNPSREARALLARILARARAAGLDQRTLAERAGISPESLSRLKRSGHCRLTTALALAQAAGVRRIELVTGVLENVATAIAAAKLSAGRRRAIDEAELVAALSRTEPPAAFVPHLCGFFEELPIESVHDVALEQRLDYGHLHALATSLGAEGETVDWLAEMAGDGVATAA